MPDTLGPSVTAVLILLGLFQVKHMFADFYLQTAKMLSGRCQYFHMGRAQHAGVHTLGSVIVLALMGTPLWFIAVICLAEWIVHFHIDYWKGHHTHCKALTPDQGAYWRAVGFDQFLHQMTYLAMVAAWACC